MAKNLTTFMPGVKIPDQALDGFEVFFTPNQFGGDYDGNRNEEYGKSKTRFCLKESMCDITAYIHGGGEAGAGFCCCQQGDPGYSGIGNRYSVCCHGDAGTDRCDEYLIMCIGSSGNCTCTTCLGHEACMSTMGHCNRVAGTTYFCLCGGAYNGGSITNCQWGYNNNSDIAARGLGGCWNSFCCSGASCCTCCIPPSEKNTQTTTVGWDCNYCVSCGNSGYNMYRGQCCSDGICGVAYMGSGPNVTGPFVVGNHIMRMGWGCEQEHCGIAIMCEFWYETGQHGNDYAHMRTTGRSTPPGRGCAGGCACGGWTSGGWGYIRYKDPDQVANGFGQE